MLAPVQAVMPMLQAYKGSGQSLASGASVVWAAPADQPSSSVPRRAQTCMCLYQEATGRLCLKTKQAPSVRCCAASWADTQQRMVGAPHQMPHMRSLLNSDQHPDAGRAARAGVRAYSHDARALGKGSHHVGLTVLVIAQGQAPQACHSLKGVQALMQHL